MKKIKLYIICFMLLSSSILLISCSKKANDNISDTSDNSSSSSSTSQTFTLDELKTYDGQNGNPAYVAIDGIVYDVTNVEEWANGKHKNGLVAGADLTSALADSPHGDKVLKDLPIVGKLE
jgi:predicted heme/steroid binding protein